MLAVARRREQAIDQLFIRIGRIIAYERLDFFRRRRQAGEVVRHAANERAAIGRRIRLQAGRGKPRVNEAVDRIACSTRPESPWPTARSRLSGRSDHQFRSAFDLSITTTSSGQCAPSQSSREASNFLRQKAARLPWASAAFRRRGRHNFQQITRIRIARRPHIRCFPTDRQTSPKKAPLFVRGLMAANTMLLENRCNIAAKI